MLSSQLNGIVSTVALRIGWEGSHAGTCECEGYKLPTAAGINRFGKHIGAAFLVLSHETAHTSCTSLAVLVVQPTVTDDYDSDEDNAVDSGAADSLPVVHRNKRAILGWGPKHLYAAPPQKQTFVVTRQRLSQIFDFESHKWLGGTKGLAADRLRKLLQEEHVFWGGDVRFCTRPRRTMCKSSAP